MIRNNLAIILAERQIKITKVSNDTGISRTTLTALVQNSSKMVQIETVNKICLYLDLTTNDFFSFVPLDVYFNVYLGDIDQDQYNATHLIEYGLTGFMNIETKQKKFILPLVGSFINVGPAFKDAKNSQLDCSMKLKDKKDLSILGKYIDPLSTAFKIDIQNNLISALDNEIQKDFKNDEITFTNGIFKTN